MTRVLDRLRGDHERRGHSPPRGIRLGQVAIVIQPLRPLAEELPGILQPPWPSWVRELYGLEALEDPRIDVADNQTSLAAAMGALSTALHHRLQLIAWVLASLADLHWDIRLQDDRVVATRVLTPQSAREELDEAGVLGPMSKVCDLDEDGFPRLWEAGDRG